MTNINDLLNKIENEGKTPAGRVSAEEFNRLVKAVGENQGAVHKVTIDNVEFTPDDDGNVTLIIDRGSITYSVRLLLESLPSETQMNSDVSINVKITSTANDGGVTEPVTETCRLRILTSNDGETYSEAGYIPIRANQTDYVQVSLKPYLHNGYNYIQLIATSPNSNTSSLQQSFTVNVVNLALTPNTAFEVPFTQFLTLNYFVSGTIDKEIQFEFGKGLGSDFKADYTYTALECTQHIGESTNTSTGITFEFDGNSALLEDMLSAGVHTVRARLVASNDSSIRTDWAESQFMVVGDMPLIVINNVQSGLTNWTDVHFFDWAVSQDATIVFRLANEQDTETYTTWQFNASTNTKYEFTTQLGIELQNSSSSAIYAYMHVEDEDGNEISSPIFFAIANSADFVPTSGADFIISPAARNNSEAKPNRIINNVNGNEVPATFTNFGFITDGWMNVNRDVNSTAANAAQLRALHIPSGRKLDIDYNPFSSFTSGNNTGQNATMEIDFRTSNILDENDPIITIGTTAQDGEIWGFQMLPTKAYLATERERNIADQDTDWAEDIRTHLVVNVVYNLGGLNYVRIFINGIIEREFTYQVSDRFTTPSGVHIVMGNTTSDLDIFGVRVYKKALATEDVMRDYRSSLSTSTEKIDFQNANSILIDNEIDFDLAKAKYNVIGHTGHLPKYGQQNKGRANGVSLYIGINGDPDHSGTLTNLESSGQGTTAMTYYDWNQQYKIGDSSVFICDNKTTYAAGRGYAIKDGEALAKKLVGKINFASSMQAHKLGLTWIFTDLYKRLIADGRMTSPTQFTYFPESRIAVYEKPFLFFHRETANDPWEFKYLMTFGAGKGDKPTFGFDKNVTPDMLMVEGADNDRPLALFAMPWNDDIVYDPENEAWMYNNQKQLNFGFGTTSKDASNNEFPSSIDAINAMKAFFNFAYLHHTGITYFEGTINELKANSEADTSKLYWVTQDLGASKMYDLYRYDSLTQTWVDAGIKKNGVGDYDKLNLRAKYEEQCAESGVTPNTWTTGQWGVINDTIKSMRRRHFADFAKDYVDVDDALYHSCFVKFFAGTDNRAKNTYYYTDPGTLKIRFMQDDLDTVIKTNNVGQNRKPYYVEEHDTNENGEYYWQGESSGFYNVLEEAFAERMTQMMRYMMTGMARLGGSVMGFLEKYFLSTQDYFPAIAYNEQARLVYERAAVAQNAGDYVNSAVQAITQSCGSQRWSEYQWLLDRVMYISSWCEYGEFAASQEAPNGLSWRGTSATYTFTLTPAKWLYPRIGTGGSNSIPSNSSTDVGGRVRVPAGQAFTFEPIKYTSDATIGIRGINHYLDIGDMNVGLASGQGTFPFAGRKLQRITINPNGTDTNVFLAGGIAITNATNIKELIIRNVDTAAGTIDLSKCTRLEKIDLRGSTFTGVDFPASNVLAEARLGSGLSRLELTAQPNLSTLTLEDASSLKTVRILGNNALDTYNEVIALAYTGGAEPETVEIDHVDWTVSNTNILERLAAIPATLSGEISVTGSRSVSFAVKRAFVEAWGEIDDTANPLHLTYAVVALSGFAIYGQDYLGEAPKDYPITITPNEAYGNNFRTIRWSMTASPYATIDARTGVVSVTSLGTEELAPTATLTCVITLADGTELTATHEIGLYLRSAHVGDYVYYDGTYSDKYEATKTVVGKCMYIDPDFPEIRIMVSKGYITTNYKDFGLRSDSDPKGIVLADDAAYNVYDTPVVNLTTTANNVTITDSNYRNAENTDFKEQAKGTAMGDIGVVVLEEDLMGHKAGEILAVGQYKTLIIIRHRNKILSDSGIMLPIPQATVVDGKVAKTENEALDGLIREIVASNSSGYRLFYYPSASHCYAFEPTVKSGEVLAEKFKAHNWFLPSSGELARMYWYHSKGYTVGVENAIFADSHGVFTRFYDYCFYSSTETSATMDQVVVFRQTNQLLNHGKDTGYLYTYAIRPCCLF